LAISFAIMKITMLLANGMVVTAVTILTIFGIGIANQIANVWNALLLVEKNPGRMTSGAMTSTTMRPVDGTVVHVVTIHSLIGTIIVLFANVWIHLKHNGHVAGSKPD